MSLKYDIEIDVSGAEQADRAAVVAFLYKLLARAEENVIVQHADPEIDKDLMLDADQLREKLRGKTVFVREIMHD
jgi:hypothetical protein